MRDAPSLAFFFDTLVIHVPPLPILRSHSFHCAAPVLRSWLVRGIFCLHCSSGLPGCLGLATGTARCLAETGRLARREVWPGLQQRQTFAVPWPRFAEMGCWMKYAGANKPGKLYEHGSHRVLDIKFRFDQ